MKCRLIVGDALLLRANEAGFPIVTSRFSVVVDEAGLLISAHDALAFRAASNAVWNILTASTAMKGV